MATLQVPGAVNFAMTDSLICQDPQCAGPLPASARRGRRYCSRACNNRHWKAINRGDAEPIAPPAPRPTMTDLELGYLGGILDGEGTFGIARKKHKDAEYRYPLVQLLMTDEDVVRRCASSYGRGRVWGPLTPPSREGKKPTWLWRLQGSDASELMLLVHSLVGERRHARITEVLDETRRPDRE